MKSGGGGVRQYVTVERPIGTSKPAQIDRKFLVISKSNSIVALLHIFDI